MKFILLLVVLFAIGSRAAVVPKADGSCVARCGENDPANSCQCNTDCTTFSDCCPDYDTVCFTCQDRCDDTYVFSAPCACNSECSSHGNCCDDYNTICSGGSGGTPTDADILTVTEQIYTAGHNDYVRSLIAYDPVPPGPLFINVDGSALSSDTMQTFQVLRPYYEPDTCIADDKSASYLSAKSDFLDAIMATSTMNITEDFLNSFSLLNDETLRDFIDTIFFGVYTRCSSTPTEGSSGFEHSLCGELDEGDVKGFHNWVSFYLDEQAGELEYTEYIDELIISEQLSIFMMGFDWQSLTKPISSMWIGSTPEMEIALYCIAFLYQPNTLVDVSMNGVVYAIQTYTQDYNGGTYFGSAYPDIK